MVWPSKICRRAAVLLVSLAAAAGADMGLDIHDGWIRYIPGDRPMAGYFVLENKGERHRYLSGAESPAFAAVHVHETVQRDGAAGMRPVARLKVPALERVAFAPGGYHLMLTGPQRELAVGDQVPVTLNFEDGASQSAVFIIQPSWQE